MVLAVGMSSLAVNSPSLLVVGTSALQTHFYAPPAPLPELELEPEPKPRAPDGLQLGAILPCVGWYSGLHYGILRETLRCLLFQLALFWIIISMLAGSFSSGEMAHLRRSPRLKSGGCGCNVGIVKMLVRLRKSSDISVDLERPGSYLPP